MRAFTFLSTLLLSTALALPALAGTAPLVSPWQTGMMKTQDGKFAYCMTQGAYAGETKIIVALTAGGDINLGVEQQGGKFPVGGEKPVKVSVDSLPPFMFTARAVKPTMMVINAGRDPALLDAMAKGSTLKIDGQGFVLKGSGEAVATLRECVAVSSQGAEIVQAAPKPQTAPAPAPVVTAPAAPTTASAEVAAPGRRSPIELPPSLRAAEEAKVVAAAKPAEEVEAKPFEVKPVVVEAPKAVVEAPKPVMAEAVKPAEVAVAKTEVVVLAPVVAQPEPPAPEPAKAALVAPAVAASATTTAAPAPSLAPELIPPAATTVAAPAAAVLTPSVVMQTLPNGIKPLPAPLLKLLTDAKLAEVKPALAATGQAFAWQSRDMKGYVAEQRVEANSPLTLLAARYSEQQKSSCGDLFTVKLGQEKTIDALKVISGNIVCHAKGQSIYMTQVYSLSETGVFTVINHSIDRGRRAAPDKAQAGVLAALAGQ